MSSFMSQFGHFPTKLFRLSATSKTKLRDYTLKKSASYDILTAQGIAQPIASVTYERPNGASMKPLSAGWFQLVQKFKGSKVVVFEIPEVPEDLILIHEHSDHYSLQPRVSMPLDDLNKKIDAFLKKHAKAYDREKWLAKYQKAVGAQASSSSSAGQSSHTQGQVDWIWDAEYQRYYYVDANGQSHWAPASTQGGTADRPGSSHSTSSAKKGQQGEQGQQGGKGQKGH
ncbi:uncharacterized protein P884DRAFT_273585 [Thermothelomyces heterothallicus CBS 202.75]|uniref:uncharacterized protein n=1 Tax=Thermothelomyces heterothallicus CBS 202.75 TaxID=1149848 RepID=UPI003744978E